MKSTTVPIIRFEDAERAISWLCKAFGFQVFLEVKGETEAIEHARLILEGNMVMLASSGRDGRFEECFKSPSVVRGITQCTSLIVSDPDQIYKTAVAEGAEIIDDIADFEFGGRTFSCRDIESHVWVFTSHDPWNKFW